MANELKEKQQKLKKVRVRNIVLNLVCICLAGSGLWWTATYFWRYVNYEVTNDAFVDQYVAPLNVRASGYIKEVRFKEHQYVRQGDTLLVLDNREYQIKVKEAEAALLDAHGSQDVLHSGIETSHGWSPADFRCKVQVFHNAENLCFRNFDTESTPFTLLTLTVIGIGSMEFPVFTSKWVRETLPQPSSSIRCRARFIPSTVEYSSTPFSYLALASVAFFQAHGLSF